VFGQTQPAQTGGLFGSTFGQNQQQNQQQQQPQQQNAFGSTGIFGQPKPATTGTGLFGQTQPAAATSAQPTGGLFGGAFGTNNASQGATTNAFGSNLFGQPKPANAFGATQQAAPAANTSLFGGNQSVLNVSALGSGAQPGLTASIAQPIGANLPIFDLLGPGPRSIVLDQPKKKSVFFADIPTRQPIPRLQLGYTPSQSKLRGFTSTTNGPASLTFSNNSNALAISTTGAPIGTEAFFNGGASAAGLGTGGRSSVKKLVLDRDVATSDLFAQFGGRATPGSLKKGTTSKPSFNAALGIASREKDVTAPPPPPAQPAPLPTPQPEEINRNGATPNPGEPQEGEYWIQPTIPELKKLGYDQLSAFEGLVVGRVGHGQVEFTDPVNLTEVPRLQNLLGGVVQFEHKECSIYPDNSEETKPPYGQGLNVRATITIYNAWPIDKTTKEHIKDRNHKRMKRHIEILKSIPNAHFESFDYETGTWVFRVEGF
jgi:nuclear pore complex protein Nup98-Nup96